MASYNNKNIRKNINAKYAATKCLKLAVQWFSHNIVKTIKVFFLFFQNQNDGFSVQL